MMRKKAGIVIWGILISMSTLLCAAGAAEKDYPARQIEYISTYPPGGSMEIGSRIVQPPLQAALGVPVVITYKLGVAGMLGADFISKAKPDGYTIACLSNSALVTGPIINASINYKYTDFASICTFLADEEVIVCRPDSRFNTVEKFIEYAKKNPGKLTYASPGMGSLAFFVMELFKMATELDIAAVHYQGSAPTVTATLGGHTDLGCAGLSAYLPQIKAGKLVPLIVTGDRRLEAFPNVPTMKEKGMDTLSVWNGLFAPPKTPKAAIDRIDREMAKIMKDPQILSKFEKGGILPFYRNSEATHRLMETETALITKVVKKLGMGK